MFNRILAIIVLCTLCVGIKVSANPVITGFGIMGDSRADEYRADDNRGGAYSATTFNWVELLVRYRNLNAGTWGTYSYPRRTGYAYNWALSGATAADLIAIGEHTGLAQQVQQGLVSHAIIDIGANDFTNWNNTYTVIYDGTLNDAGVAAKVSTLVANITTAVDTVRAAGSVDIAVVNLADRGTAPNFIAIYPDATKRARVTNAVISVNQGLSSMVAARSGVVLIDSYNFGTTFLANNVDAQGNYHLGGHLITLLTPGDEPHHSTLGDNEHLGTVFGGILANFYVGGFNSAFGTTIAPFTDNELLVNAGITGPPPDITLPTVTLTSPTNGQVVHGFTLTLSATASDNVGVTLVTFQINGQTFATDSVAPYTQSRDSHSAPNGQYTATAIAKDAAGNTKTSNPVTFTIQH